MMDIPINRAFCYEDSITIDRLLREKLVLTARNVKLKARVTELEDEIRYRNGMEALKNQPNPPEEV